MTSTARDAAPVPSEAAAAWRHATWVVIAAYREVGVIGEVVGALCRAGWRVVVVDDGSDDGTAEAAARGGAWVLRHAVNLGQGAALRTGFAFVLSHADARIAVTFDADGQHSPAAIEPLVAPIVRGDVDVTLGSRFLDPGSARAVPRTRRALLRLATLLARMTTGLRLTDTHNGLRAFTTDALGRLNLLQDRMAHASEIQAEIARQRLRYQEVSVQVAYTQYSVAKGQRVIDAVSIIWELLLAKLR
jgi:glycosyltransferase involved in cell wall biosynthesis